MTALDGELGRSEKFRELPPLTEKTGGALNFITLQLSKLNRRVVRGIVAGIITIAVFLTIVSVWRSHKASNPLANLPPAVYQPAQSGETMPLPAAPRRNP